MAKRTGKSPSRLELRKAHEAAAKKSKAAAKDEKPEKAESKKAAAKKKATKRKTTKTPVSERYRMMWGVFDNSAQQVAVFAYSQKSDAEKKLKDMEGKPRGPFFLQPVKEAIPEPEQLEEES
jgi:hypothetical protein